MPRRKAISSDINKLPPKKANRRNSGDDEASVTERVATTAGDNMSPVNPVNPATTSQHQQQELFNSQLSCAMSESRSSSPIALTTKQSSAFHHAIAQQHLNSSGIGENLVPAELQQAGVWTSSHAAAAADALVNLSNQHASRGTATASYGNSASLHQLPPACGAKQLSKLKRFLTTLVQSCRDISHEISDRVRMLILALVNNIMNVEEFHSKLQDLTGHPLRPFVIPFLKANLPLLQRELAYCAQVARQTPQQFLLSNESLVYAPFVNPNAPPLSPQQLHQGQNGHSKNQASPVPAEPADLESPFEVSPFHGRTRRTRQRSPDNGSMVSSRSSPTTNVRRARSRSPLARSQRGASTVTPNIKTAAPPISQPAAIKAPSAELSWLQQQSQRVTATTSQQQATQLPPPLTSVSAGTAAAAALGILGEGVSANEELWRLLDQQLNALAEAASNCRRSSAILRDRSRDELASVLAQARIGARLGVAGASQEVDEIRRRAEEAVNEIKRQACDALQRGVAAAEQKAREMVASERSRMTRDLAEAKQRGYDEATAAWTIQEFLPENCANCGRSASERCSACEQVRYCGRFCQHHDWHRHRLRCRSVTASSPTAGTVDGQPSERQDDVLQAKVEAADGGSNESNVGSPPLPTTKSETDSNSNMSTSRPQQHSSKNESGDLAKKPESLSPVGAASSISSSSCNGQARPESRHSTSAATPCH